MTAKQTARSLSDISQTQKKVATRRRTQPVGRAYVLAGPEKKVSDATPAAQEDRKDSEESAASTAKTYIAARALHSIYRIVHRPAYATHALFSPNNMYAFTRSMRPNQPKGLCPCLSRRPPRRRKKLPHVPGHRSTREGPAGKGTVSM